jgi:hypothetical protein
MKALKTRWTSGLKPDWDPLRSFNGCFSEENNGKEKELLSRR